MKWFRGLIVYIPLSFIVVGIIVISSHAPRYVRYTDQWYGASFEYSPSISQVSTGAAMNDSLIYIYPLNAQPSDESEVVVTIEPPCEQKCPEDMVDHVIKSWSSPGSSVTIVSTSISVGNHIWIKAEISDPPSPTQEAYVTVAGKNIVWVGNWTRTNPTTTKVFNRVLESLKP